MKKYWVLLAALFMLSCSDNNELGTEEPDSDGDDEEVLRPEFKVNRMLIKHGLQLQCWVASDNYELANAAKQPAYNLSIPDWKLSGFTGPVFFCNSFG